MSTHSALRYEAALKVTGSAVYEAEVPAVGMLHAALVEASISCGDVLSVDATQAIDLPGFAATVSYADTEVLQPSPATALIRDSLQQTPCKRQEKRHARSGSPHRRVRR
jgi:xanthine dehydrogenase YagR molybdenum-binding subunit